MYIDKETKCRVSCLRKKRHGMKIRDPLLKSSEDLSGAIDFFYRLVIDFS